MFPSPSLPPPPPPPPPPPLPPTRPPQWKYDVFVSFRGKDLRRNFMPHLFSALKQASIRCFRDNAREDIGEEIKSKFFRVIWHARFALIVFSKNYADSKWCMNELVEILECKRRYENHGHLVVPIFLDVKPEDVSKLMSGSEFAQGFKRLSENERDNRQIQKWRNALTETKHLSGIDLRNDAGEDEGTLVDIIVDNLIEKIQEARLLYFARNAIGLELLVDEVISLIKMGQEEDVRVVGVCGVEGIGKTMAAAVICKRICHDFECVIFLDKIGEADCNNPVALLGLQKKLLYNLVKVEGLRMCDDIQTNINEIKSNMCHKRILLVLDNVTRKGQLDYFGAGEREQLCPGSRILITTRDQKLLKDLKVDGTYILRGLDPNEALRLFCRHAIKREEPHEGYEELCKNLAHYAGGHPFSLEKLGSSLWGKSKYEWHKKLEQLKRCPYVDSLFSSFRSVGPYGGEGGDAFDDGRHTGVRQIRLVERSVIDSITVDYDQNGCLVRSVQRGRDDYYTDHAMRMWDLETAVADLLADQPIGKNRNNPMPTRGKIDALVRLDHPSEYLVSVSGYIDDFGGRDVVRSLKIQSNRKTYGPFGSERGRPFDLAHPGGQIIGFHGRCSSHLDSIGAHFGPISHVYPFDVVGPFGGDSGMDFWDDGKHTDVRQIVIGFDSAIKSISILYDDHGRPVGPFTHGPSEGGKTYTIKLNHPSEYLTSISGYTEEISGLTILRSLTIHTNRRDYGPIGTANKGRHFSFPHTGGKIVGFYGSCDGPRLESIGAFCEPIPHTHPQKDFGPLWGDDGDHWDDGMYVFIKRISVCFLDFIHYIGFDVINMDRSIRHIGHGSERGLKSPPYNREVNIDYPWEFITSISGFFTDVVVSLTFRTNRRIYGPFGREEGVYFSLPLEAGIVVGSFGRSGDFIHGIGVRVKLYSKELYPFKCVGLFGVSGEGSCWDDGNKHTNVRKIIVEFEPSKGSRIRSIAFEYEEEGKELCQSGTHGGVDDKKFHTVRNIEVHTIKIHDPDEYLTSISGYYDTGGGGGITSITFQTNIKTIGPIGGETGRHFSSPATGGKIVGFYGRSGEHLEAIGAYFEPIAHLYPIKSIGPFGGLGGCAWDDGKFDGVREILVTQDGVIRYLMFVYDKRGEQICPGTQSRYTEEEKSTITRVRLDYPREYLTSISGYVREDGDSGIDNAVVQSLTFHSNRGRHGPFGKETGKYFWYPSTGSRIIGFYGRSKETLNSIGVYVEPIPHLYPFKTIGPFGGSGYFRQWDDGVHSDVRTFEISFGDVIHSIQVGYDDNGSISWCHRHGKGDGPRNASVILDYPKERLVSISGCMNKPGNAQQAQICIRNLSIHTTKTTYGPFGSEIVLGRFTGFRIPPASSDGKIVGFFGSVRSCLISIGARLEPY